MPNSNIFPIAQTLVALATQTTSGTSAALNFPYAQGYRLIVETSTVSGTSPTLQVIMATSTDGTVYTEVMSLTQITTTGLGRQVTFTPYLSAGAATTDASVGLLGTTDMASGSVILNGPINTQYIKFRWVVGGTSPSFAFAIKLIGVAFGGLSGN